ncbi:MAG: PKD domain-containing protein [Bacteroidia bacterium]
MKPIYPTLRVPDRSSLQRFFVFCCLIQLSFFSKLSAQQITNTTLQQFSVSTSTADKPQSKTWNYNGSWYCVMANSSGTRVWKLNGTVWSSVFTLTSSNNLFADVKIVGNLAHILLFEDVNDNVLIQTLQYNTSTQTYQAWSANPNSTTINLGSGGGRKTETASMDIDSQGKMWMCYERNGIVNVRWSNSPYNSWSSDIQIVSGLDQRDIAAISTFSDAQGSKIGVAWSNHNAKRFGFKYHLDTNAATTWSSDEVPGNANALNVGIGMADDHINLASTSNGHLFMAAKTSYDQNGYPTLILLERKPNQSWSYYEVEFNDKGTKPIIVANEAANKLVYAYCYPDNKAGDLVYKVADLNSPGDFATANRTILLSRDGSTVDMASSTKDLWTNDLVILAYHASSGTVRSSRLAMSSQDNIPPSVPANLSSTARTFESIDIQWSASTDNVGVAGYRVYLNGSLHGTTSNTNFSFSGLDDTTSYNFQVAAFDATGNTSALSAVFTESTLSIPPQVILNIPPTAALGSDISGGVAPITVNFDGSASFDTDGTIVSYGWAFGDGNTATGPTVSHTYPTPGNYVVVLTVTDDSNATDTESITIAATNKLSQTITFAPLANKQTTDGPFTVSATASSGLPVSFSLISGPATLNGNTITLTGTDGTVIIRASQGGDATYQPAANVDQSFDVLVPGSTVSVMAQINASSDDVEERISNGKMDVTSSDLELGFEGTNAQLTAMRFTGLNIPQGSIILNAYIQFTVDEVKTGATSLTIHGEASDNVAVYPSSNFSATNRPKTSANTSWVPAPWNTVGEQGPDQQTPDISAIIQEIVSRPGWTISSALGIMIDGTGTRTAESYDGSTTGAPKLFVEYQPASAPARTAGFPGLTVGQDIELFPNPFQEEFFLKTEIAGAEWIDVTIFNSIGQVVHVENRVSTTKPARIRPELTAGIYTVIIRTDNGQIRRLLSVKN